MIIHKPYTNDKYAYGYKLRSSTCIVVIELIIKNCQFIGADPKRSLWLPFIGPVHVPKSGATYRNNKQIQSIDNVINYTCMLILCTRNGLTGK